MRRTLTMLAVMIMTLGVVAAPALADGEFTFTDTDTFEDVNPCSGETITITIEFLVQIHEHPDDFSVRVRRTGSTSDGFIMAHGSETFSAVDGVEQGEFMDPWNNPATGDKFVAQGRFLAIDGEVVFEDFRLECRT